MKEFPPDLLDYFTRWVQVSITERGVYPSPCLMYERGKEGKVIAALDITPEECMKFFWGKISRAECTAIVMGFDRYAKPGQGTELGDLLSVFMWHDDSDKNVWHTIQYGIIEYQAVSPLRPHEPQIVKPLNFQNTHWNEQLLKELRQTRPETCIRIK